jgi:lysophospholipase L1-like esterase
MSESIRFSLLSRLVPAVVLALASAVFASAQPPAAATSAPVTPPQVNVPHDAPLNPSLPTLFIVGDSTARNNADLGWGDHLAHLFDTTRINVANRAVAGRSSRTFINEGRWDNVLAEMKPGDFVLIQWGHNDGGDLGGTKPRGTLKGIGEETQDVPQTTGPLTGKTETIHTYGWYLRKYIADARAGRATPILLTLTIRNVWKPGANGVPQIERDMGYREAEFQLSAAQHVPIIDMATVEADRLQALGPEKTALLFPIDHTHTSAEGAELNAQSVVIALQQGNSLLVAFLKENIPLPVQTAAAAK